MTGERRYSRLRYSVNREERETGIAETFSEALGALAGAAVPVFVRERYAEALQGSARGTVSVIASFTEEDSLTAAARMSAACHRRRPGARTYPGRCWPRRC